MRAKLLPFILFLSFVAGCAPYKMDIRQGNLLTPEMRERLRVGMSHNQVQALLGQPMLMDPLHANRWDYVYTYEQDHVLKDKQHLTLYFTGDTLTRIDDSHMPPLHGKTPGTGGTP